MFKLFLLITFLPFFSKGSWFVPVGHLEEYKKSHRTKGECEKLSGFSCFDIEGKDLRYIKVETSPEDDKSKPIYKERYNVVACSDEMDCTNKLSAELEPYCDQGQNDFVTYEKNVLLPGMTYGCSGIVGYEQVQVTKLIVDQALKTQVLAKDIADKEKREGVERELNDIEFGKKLMAIIGYSSKKKGLTPTQIQSLRSAVSAAESALSVGAIEQAKVSIEGYTPDGTLLTQQDKDDILEEINNYLSNQ